MFMDVPPAPPAITAQQQADLNCARVALTTDASKNPAAKRMLKVYVARLQASDPKRDWSALATPYPPDMKYGEFFAIMNTCVAHRPRRRD